MSYPRRLAVALALIPTLALAWMPYNYGPYQPGPESDDRSPDPGMGAFGPMGPMPYMNQQGGLRITQSATDEAYLLDIQLSGTKPADIKVAAQGPWILVTREDTAQSTREETFSDGRGYQRSFSYSSGHDSRRFNVPRDGNAAAMQRQDSEDAIHISIPRAKAPTGSR